MGKKITKMNKIKLHKIRLHSGKAKKLSEYIRNIHKNRKGTNHVNSELFTKKWKATLKTLKEVSLSQIQEVSLYSGNS